MIFTERTITVVNDSATINKPLILYRGDKNIELKITIAESQFKFRNNDASNVIETTDASYAQLVINTPYNSPIFSDVAVTKNGAVIFVITEAMIDEIREVGAYEIQIRLLDDNKQSRASIPPVSNAIEIREPIAIEDGSAVDSNAVNTARVNRALTTTSAPLEAFDSQGNYIKKTWGDGDSITDAALNKLEAGIDGVNKKVANNSSQIKEIVKDASLPSYYEDMLSSVNDKIFDACYNVDSDINTFIMFSDTHYDLSKTETETLFKCMGEICKNNNIEFIVNCGDVIGDSDTSTKLTYFNQYNEYIGKYIKDIPYFAILGNHDRVGTSEGVKQLSNLHLNKNLSNITNINKAQMYYSVKNINAKTKYIFLNEYDVKEISQTNQLGFTYDQLTWLRDELIDSNNYDIVIFNHRPILGALLSDQATIYNRGVIGDILKAYYNREAYSTTKNTVDEFAGNINCDFTSCTGRIIGIFAGHYHADTDNTSIIPEITIVNALCTKDNYTSGKGVIYDRTLGTTSEIAFDIVVVRKDTSDIKIIRFGVGDDRTIAIPNNELAPELDKSIEYEYTDGYKIVMTTGEAVTNVNNIATLAYIECPTVPFKIVGNNTWKDLVFYDESKAYISSEGVQVDYDISDLVVSTIPDNAKYIRFSANYKSNDGCNSTRLNVYATDTSELLFYVG